MTKVKIRFKVYEIPEPENDPYGQEKWYTRIVNFDNLPKLYSTTMVFICNHLTDKIIPSMSGIQEVLSVKFDIM